MPFADTKSLFASKTFWANFLTTVAGVLTYLGGEAWIKAIPGSDATLLVVLGLVNVALRYVTVDAVKILPVVIGLAFVAFASEASAAVQVVSAAAPAVSTPKPAVVITRPGYTCGPNGCYPNAAAVTRQHSATRSSACANGQCGVARGGFFQRLRGR